MLAILLQIQAHVRHLSSKPLHARACANALSLASRSLPLIDSSCALTESMYEEVDASEDAGIAFVPTSAGSEYPTLALMLA
mmetsp:Transcript_38231/g.69779  ORF Transcript_38231/g.69779 Transcript_38231/m.69779 type:complete len:81 (-) Transcript_38231:1497-1739(-)